ncbi:hypothetical protein EBZ80_02375 [bacterium]|nr:hypothetical protein [bacterium]
MIFFGNPERDGLYALLTRYYEDPVMTKIRDMEQPFSMYAVRLPCMLMNEKRYLISIVDRDDRPVGYRERLAGQRWKVLQARALEDEKLTSLGVHPYEPKRDPAYKIPLVLVENNREISVYEGRPPIFRVSLLHTKNQEIEYWNEGNLAAALETFQTVISWKG